MYKLNKVKYATASEAAEAVDKYLTIFIEEYKELEKQYQFIINNNKIDSLDEEVMDNGIMKRLISVFKKRVENKIAKMEVKQQRILDKKNLAVLVKDVDKSIKLYPKSHSINVKFLEQYKNASNAYEIELVKMTLEVIRKSIKAFEEQRALNDTFRDIEQER